MLTDSINNKTMHVATTCDPKISGHYSAVLIALIYNIWIQRKLYLMVLELLFGKRICSGIKIAIKGYANVVISSLFNSYYIFTLE